MLSLMNEVDPLLFRCTHAYFQHISHPPSAALIREFYLNLSVHSDDSNTKYVLSWIRGVEYIITPSLVAFALGVPLVR